MRRLTAIALAASLLAATAARAATITIVNADGAGEGFNDPTPAVPVGGNTGVTVGAQRLIVFQTAANIWGGILPSNITILVNAQFNPLTCTATSGVLGSAGAAGYYRDFTNAPFAGTWYHVALANKLANADLDGGATPDINAQFNSSVGTAGCLPMGWYLGLDGNEGGQIELLPVVLHELGHGLGFSTITNGSTGTLASGFPSAWDHFLLDDATGLHWTAESDAQRAASGVSCGKLVWDGVGVHSGAHAMLGPKPMLRVTAPAPIANEYAVGTASFGPALGAAGVTGQVVLVQDSFGNTTNACENIVNSLTGKIALLDRGTCGFTVKVKNAQLAGAIGAIVADSLPDCPPAGMGGADASITIPSVRIPLADGAILKANLGSGVTATLVADPARQAGTDAAGRVMMYTPNPYQSGSSVSHWDTSAEPSLLMEPAITTGLSQNVDLTLHAFADLGWIPVSTAATLALFVAEDRAEGIQLAWQFADPASVSAIAVERSLAETGPWAPVAVTTQTQSGRAIAIDATAELNTTYFYRLAATEPSGAVSYFGLVSARHASPLSMGRTALMAASPNPTAGVTAISFALGSAGPADVSVYDVVGREVLKLVSGMQSAGLHVVQWSGQDASGRRLPAGMYRIRLRTAGFSETKSLVVVR